MKKLSSADEVQDGASHLPNVNLCIDAGTVRPIVQNPEHRDWISILDARGKIMFTGHRHDAFGPVLHDDSPGQCAPRGDCNLHLVLVRKLDQFFDLALPATFAVLDVSRDLNLTVEILYAMGKEDHELAGPCPVRVVGPDEMVIELDERLLYPLLRHPKQLPHQDHERKKHLGHNPPQLIGKKDVPAPYDREDEQKPSCKHEENKDSKGQAEDKRQGRMDILQPHQWHIPEEKDKKGEDQTGDDQQSDENPFPWPNVQNNPLLQNSMQN